MGGLERPKVERITGLSPVIAIEQKTISRNPRSTVGTVTELLDFLRVLFARLPRPTPARPENPWCASPMKASCPASSKTTGSIVAPSFVRGRKGHYRELFETIQKQATRARVDGEVVEPEKGFRADRYKA